MRRLILGVICAIMLTCGTSQSAKADLFSNFQSTSYGSYCTPYYRTSYYRPVFGYRAYYAPVYRYGVRTYYSPTCSPCGSSCSPCSPCGVSCGFGCSPCQSCRTGGNCPGGNCAVNSATRVPADDNWKPTPADGGPPPTYKEGEGAPGPPQESNEGRVPPGTSGEDASGENVESLKPATDVPQRKAVPIKGPEAGDNQEKKAGEAAEEKADDKATPVKHEELSFPSLNVDEKITWRSRPIRKRLTIRSRFPTPSVARNRVNPNDKWAPVPTTTIVSK